MSANRREVKDCSARPFVQIDAELIKGLTNSEFKIYAQIKKRAGSGGECWESLPHMAAETGTSVSALRDAIKGLARKGLIKKIVRPGHTDLYELTPPEEWNLSTHVKSTHLPTLNPRTYPRGFNAPTHVDLTHDLDPIELDPINTPLYPPRGEGVVLEIPQGVKEGIAQCAPVGKKKASPYTDEEVAEFWARYPKKVNKPKSLAALQKVKQVSMQLLLDALDWQTEHYLATRQPSDGWQYFPNPQAWLNGQRWLDEKPEGFRSKAETEAAQNVWESDPRRNPLAKQLKELGLNAGYTVDFEQSPLGEWLLVSKDFLGREKKQAFTASVVEKSLQRCQEIVERNATWHRTYRFELMDLDVFGTNWPIPEVGSWVLTPTGIRQVAGLKKQFGQRIVFHMSKDSDHLEDTLPLRDCPYYPELQQEVSHVA